MPPFRVKQGEFIDFWIIENKNMTDVFAITTKPMMQEDDTPLLESEVKTAQHVLGQIKWRGGWRRYVFEPSTHCQTSWDVKCLNEVITFINDLMIKRK